MEERRVFSSVFAITERMDTGLYEVPLSVFVVFWNRDYVSQLPSVKYYVFVRSSFKHNCDDIFMCIVNKQFELLGFVFDYVYVDLQYDEIFLTLMLGLCHCVVFVVMWLSLVYL